MRILGGLFADPDTDAFFYLLLRAANRFHTLHGRFPGTVMGTFESDALAFEALFSAFTKENGIEISVGPQVKEIIRAGACELPNMAALIGGIASQEIIKLITCQYVPLDNAVIFNGVKSTTATFKI